MAKAMLTSVLLCMMTGPSMAQEPTVTSLMLKDQGLHLPVVAGAPAGDDALLKSFGDETIGMISSTFYSNDVDTPSNKKLIDRMVREYGNIPGIHSAALYEVLG